MTEMSVVASTFPPERTIADRPIAVDPAGEQRRDAGGARAFDDELRALEAEHDRLRDLLARHLDRSGPAARRGSLAASVPGSFTAIPSAIANPSGVGADADDAHLGLTDCTAIAIPAASPPPPTGTTTVSRSCELLGELEPERSLAGDHLRDPRTRGRTSAPVDSARRPPGATASSKLSPLISTRAP